MNTPIIKATMKMCPTIHPLSLNPLPQPTKFQPHPFPSNLSPTHHLSNPARTRTLKTSCNKDKENLSDEMLAAELGLEINKLASQTLEREEALKKSRGLLFAEVCGFAGLESEDLRKKWWKMNEDERWVLAKGFVTEWSDHFHPLSAKSVKEMVDEYLGQNDGGDGFSGSGEFFPDLRKWLGFSRNNEE